MHNSSIFLHKEDLETLRQLFEEFPNQDTVEITSDTSSGIGAVIEATFYDVKTFNKSSKVTFTLANHEDW